MKHATDQLALLEKAEAATESLCELFNANDPLIREVAHILFETCLLDPPDRLATTLLLGATTDDPPDTSDRMH
ncbi:hypothetical protein D3C76_1727120 [compost metagenome]